MKEKELIDIWKKEESVAHIHGWDFSHIEGRYTEETDLPWNYQHIILDYLNPEMKLLDIDTGGGEFLLSLRHPYVKTSATEAIPQIFSYAEKPCSLSVLIFVQVMERICCHLVIMNLILSLIVTVILMPKKYIVF